MSFDRATFASAPERELLFQLLERQELIMSEIADIKQTEAADKLTLAAIMADIDGIRTAVTSTITGQQTTIQGLETSNADLQSKVSVLEAGKALTQEQIDDLAAASKDNGQAIAAVKASADALLASVQPPAQADASSTLGSKVVGRS